MIPNPVERKMQRRQTTAFIAADAEQITIHRQQKIAKNGGWVWGPETVLPPQTIRLVPAKRRYGDATTNTEAGQVVNWPYIAEGEPDLDIQPDDWFLHQDQKYQVKSVEQDRDVKTLAFLDYFGG